MVVVKCPPTHTHLSEGPNRTAMTTMTFDTSANNLVRHMMQMLNRGDRFYQVSLIADCRIAGEEYYSLGSFIATRFDHGHPKGVVIEYGEVLKCTVRHGTKLVGSLHVNVTDPNGYVKCRWFEPIMDSLPVAPSHELAAKRGKGRKGPHKRPADSQQRRMDLPGGRDLTENKGLAMFKLSMQNHFGYNASADANVCRDVIMTVRMQCVDSLDLPDVWLLSKTSEGEARSTLDAAEEQARSSLELAKSDKEQPKRASKRGVASMEQSITPSPHARGCARIVEQVQRNKGGAYG